ncbi:MAG: DedA family protein [Hyphomicrobiaceae bacterium]|nr:DedA family protein [Hyphomicrobiaceae bacterium]
MSILDYSNQVLDFVRANPGASAAVVFALAFGESLAFVSLILPFWAMLVGIGTIIGGAGPFTFWTIVTAAACGAALGDWLSYWIGYHYHEQVRRMWPLNKKPELIDKGHVFFEKYGPWAVVLGRFSGPLRASVPIVAGITEMPWLRFQIANWASAFLWAFVLLSPGSWGLQWWLDKLK